MQKIKEQLKALSIFISLCLIAFRNILFSSGIVGRTWDWATFSLKEQALILMSFYKYSWWYQAGLGFPITYNAGLYSDQVMFSFFYIIGPVLASKLVLVLFLCLAAYSMFILCRFLKLDYMASLLAGVFYMFSPPVYSRLIAGHLNVVFGYALIPFYLYAVFSALKHKENFYLKVVIAAILLSVISSAHQMILGVVFMVNFVIFIFYLFSKETFFKSLKLWSLLGLLFLALNSFWIYPFLKNMLVSDAYFRGDLTVAEEMKSRFIMFQVYSHKFFDALIMNSTQDMGTEHIYPIAKKLQLTWLIAAYSLVALFFSTFFIQMKNREKWIFWSTALLGVFLLTGEKTFIGKFIFLHIFMKVAAVFFMFCRVNRLAFLLPLSYAILLGYVLDFLIGKYRKYA